ncbi:PREDICTED: uncharacterized protein LOC109585285 [Amphimedon queenslandica]|uniref:Uncharacterized protein n=1 Tax=Amphimedon queenslandica TaxID=400682 RepID=A0A1X7VRM1_AMPQE|nr:PREDICTED: uncharacterized protein LOC109585285 [Amphimedon queenslandica]|eukprot:XP_019856847.1 PREDICTED: uncharacterized protein LOC109585285 [Amphimedon queenslandica]
MASTHTLVVLCALLFSSPAVSVHVFLLRSPLLIYNVSTGREKACPQSVDPDYPLTCIDAIDTVYGHRDGEYIEESLSILCHEDCLRPLEYAWKYKVHDEGMAMYIRNTLCQVSGRGYCAQQLIVSTGNNILEEVDVECIIKWCPLVCKEREEEDHLTCCSKVIVGPYTFQTDSVNMYGITTRSANKPLRQYDYCGQLMMRFQSDGKCLNIIELLDFIVKLVHGDENLQNNEANRKILKEGLESYCDTDCIQIITSYYSACAGVEEAIHQLFLFKMLYCAKDGGDFCLVKGLDKMEKGEVSKYKLRIYCVAPEFFCPRESCKKAVNEAKTGLGCCCQNLFNIEGSPFRDLIPNFIVRFMECKIELPKMCGCGSLTGNLLTIMTSAMIGLIALMK